MGVRGSALRRAAEGSARSGRRSICVQCRQERSEVSAGVHYVGRQNLAGSVISRRPRFILPSSFIAGQRRALATVRNGTKLHSSKKGGVALTPRQ